MHYKAISYINLPKTYDDAILAQFVVHHATDSNRTIRVECLRCHHTCQIFKCRFAVGQLSVNCWYTAGRQYIDRLLGELFFTFTTISCKENRVSGILENLQQVWEKGSLMCVSRREESKSV